MCDQWLCKEKDWCDKNALGCGLSGCLEYEYMVCEDCEFENECDTVGD
jgi:hypothetical protein